MIDLTKEIEVYGPTEPVNVEIGLEIGHATGHHPIFALLNQRVTKEEAEAYRRLFEEAPRTKLERDKLEDVANVLAAENKKNAGDAETNAR